MRSLAAHVGASASTVVRAYAHLADVGVLEVEPRRRARIAADGHAAAMRVRDGERVFRLAGSDDPALRLLLQAAGRSVLVTASRGSFGGLRALAAGDADGAAVHLRDAGGVYNASFAQALLRGRNPHLLRLWRREQGLIVPLGNPLGLRVPADLNRRRVAKREDGAGTRVLLEQLIRAEGLDPDGVSGPEFGSHLEIALAVASGTVDAGLAVRAAATSLNLDFVPLLWEHYDVVFSGELLGAVQPLAQAARDADVRAAIGALPGYDLSRAGEIVALSG